MASANQDTELAGGTGELEALFEFLYACPTALLRMDRAGNVDLSNPAVAQLLMQVAKQPVIENLFDILDKAAPELRGMVERFSEPSGPICEHLRIHCGDRPGVPYPLVIALTMIQLSPSSIMVVFNDVSKEVAQEAAIIEANRQRGLLLDHLQAGLVMVDKQGHLDSEHSRAVEKWFGAPAAGQTLWDYVGAKLPREGTLVAMAWEQLQAGELPLRMLLRQFRRRMAIDASTTLSLDAQPLPGPKGETSRFLVQIQDVTSEVERERLAAEQADLWAMVKALQRDPHALSQFLQDGTMLVGLILGDRCTIAEERRHIHTLKGNSALAGLKRLPALCHAIEGRLASEGPEARISQADQDALRDQWKAHAELIQGLLGAGSSDGIKVSADVVLGLCDRVRRGASPQDVIRELESWRYPPLRSRLEQLGREAEVLAEKLGKAPLEVKVSCGDLRLPPERFGELLGGLVHLVRNAIDHGLEPPEERRMIGKGPAQLSISAEIEGGELVLLISDDGRGVNWARVAEKARSLGLPATRERELAQALFADGFSTREEVTEVSGRGVGLGALHGAVAALEGSIAVRSRPAEGTLGTTFELRVPLSIPAPQPARATATRKGVVRSLAPTPRKPRRS